MPTVGRNFSWTTVSVPLQAQLSETAGMDFSKNLNASRASGSQRIESRDQGVRFRQAEARGMPQRAVASRTLQLMIQETRSRCTVHRKAERWHSQDMGQSPCRRFWCQ